MAESMSPFDASTLSEIASIPREAARENRQELLDSLEGNRAKAIGEALLEEPNLRDEKFDQKTVAAALALENQVQALDLKILKADIFTPALARY